MAKNIRYRNLNRRPPFKESGETHLIICEDKKIEPGYFEALKLKKRIHTLNVQGCGASPSKVVEIGITKLNEFDFIWCVFDVEAPTPHSDLDKAIQMAQGKQRLKLIVSNPCFEYWFLLHSRKTAELMNSNDYLFELVEKEFPVFKKGDDKIIAVLMDDEKIKFAISNAKAIISEKNYENDFGDDLRKCNPSTHVHLLVEELLEMSKPQ